MALKHLKTLSVTYTHSWKNQIILQSRLLKLVTLTPPPFLISFPLPIGTCLYILIIYLCKYMKVCILYIHLCIHMWCKYNNLCINHICMFTIIYQRISCCFSLPPVPSTSSSPTSFSSFCLPDIDKFHFCDVNIQFLYYRGYANAMHSWDMEYIMIAFIFEHNFLFLYINNY